MAVSFNDNTLKGNSFVSGSVITNTGSVGRRTTVQRQPIYMKRLTMGTHEGSLGSMIAASESKDQIGSGNINDTAFNSAATGKNLMMSLPKNKQKPI